jgi:hypothetical protein
MASLVQRPPERLARVNELGAAIAKATVKQEPKDDESKLSAGAFGLAGFVRERLIAAETARSSKEQDWLAAYRNYKGVYGPEVTFDDINQSRVFVKITKTKVVAAYGQIIDVLFGTAKFPISIEPTEKPEGVAEYAHLDPANAQAENEGPSEADMLGSAIGYDGDGRSLPPGVTVDALLAGLAENQVFAKGNWQDGPSPDKMKMPQISPAKEAARKMQKVIWDQLDETNATTSLRSAAFEMVLLGTGILKGPFNYEKILHTWQKNPDTAGPKRIYTPQIKEVPRLEYVSVWDFYPDPSARNIAELGWAVQRYHLNESAMRDLMNRPLFDKEAIEETLEKGPNYEKRTYEDQLRPNDLGNTPKERFEVLEYWGSLDRKTVDAMGVDLEDKYDIEWEEDEIQVNIWVCGNYVLRLVLNPFTPTRLPYMVCPFEVDPYNIWGIGLPQNMEDSQTMMNGFARMTVDNLRYAGHLVFDVSEDSLVSGQDMKIKPGQVFKRQSGQPGQSVFGIKFPSTAQENMFAFDKFRQFADEETGIPSYSHGATNVGGTTRTASGMSMLMGAAALNIKTVIKNIDEYLLRPLGESYYQWNMQFNEEDLEIRGDIEVKARGTSALMMKEVRSQRLMTLLQVGTNPQVAPFIRWNTVLKELAVTLDIDPEELIADPEEAAIYAAIVGKQGTNGQGQGSAPPGANAAPPMGGNGSMAPGANPADATGAGGGNIGTGSVPQPGQAGFSANTGGAPQ